MTKKITTDEIEILLDALRNNEVVAFPTDTVYGIACVPSNEGAIAKMKWVKGRDEKKPFPMMVSDKSQIAQIAEISTIAHPIIEKFMPGALTIILNKKDCISDSVTNGQKTIAIRMPDDRIVLNILKKAGPLLVTSANMSGQPAAHTDAEVLAQLDGRISVLLKGVSGKEVASTIVDCTQDKIKILREGPITKKIIEEVTRNE